MVPLNRDLMIAFLESQLKIKQASLKAQEEYNDENCRFKHEVSESALAGLRAEIYEIETQLSDLKTIR